MGWKRRTAGVSGAVVVLSAISTGIVLGAVQRGTLTPQEAPPGAAVQIHVETTARWEGTLAANLFMVPAATIDAKGASASHCDEIAGSTSVGEMTWQTGAVAFGDGVYDGFIGDATFVVPAVPSGSYRLGENSPAIGSGCHVYATLEVTSGQLPDTALPSRAVELMLVAALLTMVLASAGWAVRRGLHRPYASHAVGSAVPDAGDRRRLRATRPDRSAMPRP